MSRFTKQPTGPSAQGQNQPPPAAQAPANKLEPSRKAELSHVLNRMSSIAAVFQVRTDSIANRRFAAFRDLMDCYIGAATTDLNAGHDYLHNGVNLTDEQRTEVEKLVGMIFGGGPIDAGEGAEAPPAAPKAKG